MTSIICHPLRNEDQATEVAKLVWEFFDHLRERYSERAADIDAYIAYQNISDQLTNWKTHFTPPAGECLLAKLDDKPVGIVMLRNLKNGLCEMNRMYVTDRARGYKVGRTLAERVIEAAKEMGFKEMRLDAWDRHKEALPLYTSLGFEREYNDNLKPDTMTYEMVHMRRQL